MRDAGIALAAASKLISGEGQEAKKMREREEMEEEKEALKQRKLSNVAERFSEPSPLSKAEMRQMTRLLRHRLGLITRAASKDPGEATRLSDTLVKAAQQQADEFPSMQDALKAVADPLPFLCGTAGGQVLMQMAGPEVRKMVLGKVLRPRIEPHLWLMKISWDDVSPALELIDTIEELNEAEKFPAEFLSHLKKQAIGCAAVRFAVAVAKPKLEPRLQEMGLVWNDVRPVFGLIDCADAARTAFEQPEALINELKDGEEKPPAAHLFAIALLKQPVKRFLEQKRGQKRGQTEAWSHLEWHDVEEVLLQIDDVAELRKATANPGELLAKLEESESGNGQLRKASVFLAVALAQPHVERFLNKNRKLGLTWADVKPVLQLIEDPSAFRTAKERPGSLLEKLEAKATYESIGKEAQKRFSIIRARAPIEKYLKLEGQKPYMAALHVSCVASDHLNFPSISLTSTPQNLTLTYRQLPHVFTAHYMDRHGATATQIGLSREDPKDGERSSARDWNVCPSL